MTTEFLELAFTREKEVVNEFTELDYNFEEISNILLKK